MKQEINFYRNTKKTKKIVLSAAAVCIVLLGVVLYSVGIFDGILKIKPAIFSGATLLIMLFLIGSTLTGIRDKSPIMHLDANEFYGKTTPLSKAFGKAEWKDVTHIQIEKSGGDTLVIVTVTNTEKYLGRVSKMFWNMAFDKTNQTLTLMYSASELDIDAKELFALFVDYWESAKGQII